MTKNIEKAHARPQGTTSPYAPARMSTVKTEVWVAGDGSSSDDNDRDGVQPRSGSSDRGGNLYAWLLPRTLTAIHVLELRAKLDLAHVLVSLIGSGVRLPHAPSPVPGAPECQPCTGR